ncbi:hypothetical protein [uncultured Tateyamaria sp.]|uniref:hypothetical protein n=1 Tax=Tateyamaria sp. 1078 TaxID=3417464 RepID=UPI00263493CF|nr:hypothetical protein [uncultured Tateyamaria sp.]
MSTTASSEQMAIAQHLRGRFLWIIAPMLTEMDVRTNPAIGSAPGRMDGESDPLAPHIIGRFEYQRLKAIETPRSIDFWRASVGIHNATRVRVAQPQSASLVEMIRRIWHPITQRQPVKASIPHIAEIQARDRHAAGQRSNLRHLCNTRRHYAVNKI